MSKGKLLALCIVWLVIAFAAAAAWRGFLKPTLDEREQRERDSVIEETSGDSRYRHQVQLALDGFSGYAVLRSDEFQESLGQKAIRVRLLDDQADYAGRLRRLQSGEVQMATFTIDALIKASAALQDLPAVIVAMIDETRGADALVAAKQRFPNVNALNHPQTRFVLTGDSPSETLARVVMTSFNLDQLGASPFKLMKSPEEVLAAYRKSPPNSTDVYVLWEPFVSEIVANELMHVVVDSSRFRGYIVDVLVVNRDFLLKNEPVVKDVVGAYFAAAYEHRQDMSRLVFEDGKRTHAALTAAQAAKLVEGIRWKNTVENFGHFGVTQDSGLQYIEDMILNITTVLRQTQAIVQDPTAGVPTRLFNQRILAQLREGGFHPGMSGETVVDDKPQLPVLSNDEWNQLREVGELKVPSLVFAPGTDRLLPMAQANLDELVRTLNTWPQYYVRVRGNASRRGDLEANRRLAENRAQTAAKYLVEHGIHASRVSAVGADPSGDATVSFVVGEVPY